MRCMKSAEDRRCRKQLQASGDNVVSRSEQWIDLAQLATVEITSEDSNFPIESALLPGRGPGWRAARKGEQIIRIIFDSPRPLRRIRLEFSEMELERTQEFSLRWASKPGGPFTEIVRQQWTFSPQGSTREVEDYQVNLHGVSTLELALKPDLTPANAVASVEARAADSEDRKDRTVRRWQGMPALGATLGFDGLDLHADRISEERAA
jgi:hypothetical protein